jgi:hypothetical protein
MDPPEGEPLPPPPADDHELRRRSTDVAAQIITQVVAYVIITYLRHWGL